MAHVQVEVVVGLGWVLVGTAIVATAGVSGLMPIWQ